MAVPQNRRIDLSAISSSGDSGVPKSPFEGLFWCHFNIALYFFTLIAQNLFLLFIQTIYTYLIDYNTDINSVWVVILLFICGVLETSFTASLLGKALPILLQIPLGVLNLLFKGVTIVLLGEFFTIKGLGTS
eukprot:TRINITY_DN13650_c0_g1_i2.p1 TRINITY_DN13650_c0_g1~~TRINITY_DN13650_c0_g1_i2.p1  ORF type:complete len:132 (+),score=12.10 TRINITY_DN13650_c0_g1_i2:128-523(+)